MSTIIDSYSETNATTLQVINNIASFYYIAKGQSFTGSPCILDKVVFYTSKVGSPTGNCYAKIYTHTGTYGSSSLGTGSALATSDAIDVSTISTSNSLVTWNFSGGERIELESKYYVVVVYYDNGDASNYIQINSDNTSSTHSGNFVSYKRIDGWSNGSVDSCFYVYGEPITTPTVGTKYPLPAFKV